MKNISLHFKILFCYRKYGIDLFSIKHLSSPLSRHFHWADDFDHNCDNSPVTVTSESRSHIEKKRIKGPM